MRQTYHAVRLDHTTLATVDRLKIILVAECSKG